MKTFTVLGNCQSISIVHYLLSVEEFSDTYEYIAIPPVHTIKKDNTDLLEIFRNIDLLIYQPVIDENRFGPFVSDSIKKILKKDSESICIPSMYYGGYFPTIESIEGLEGTLRGVHDFLLLAMFLSGLEKSVIIKKISEEFPLNQDQIYKLHLDSIHALKQRERKFKVDIDISGYIEENFNKRRLFHTFNHPTSEMFIYICQKIIARLCISGEVKETKDFLDSIVAPIYPSVKKALNLEFTDVHMFREGNAIDLVTLIEHDLVVYKKANREFLETKLFQKKRFLMESF